MTPEKKRARQKANKIALEMSAYLNSSSTMSRSRCYDGPDNTNSNQPIHYGSGGGLSALTNWGSSTGGMVVETTIYSGGQGVDISSK